MAGATASLVQMKPANKRLDLRGNNRFNDLLETRAEQAAILAEAKKIKDEADSEIREMIGDATEIAADNFTVSVTVYDVPEHVVKASTRRRINIRRKRLKKS